MVEDRKNKTFFGKDTLECLVHSVVLTINPQEMRWQDVPKRADSQSEEAHYQMLLNRRFSEIEPFSDTLRALIERYSDEDPVTILSVLQTWVHKIGTRL